MFKYDLSSFIASSIIIWIESKDMYRPDRKTELSSQQSWIGLRVSLCILLLRFDYSSRRSKIGLVSGHGTSVCDITCSYMSRDLEDHGRDKLGLYGHAKVIKNEPLVIWGESKRLKCRTISNLKV